MSDIPSSFMGYNKRAVNDIISQKDNKLKTQEQDIDYLRSEITELKKSLNQSSKNSKFKKNSKSQ